MERVVLVARVLQIVAYKRHFRVLCWCGRTDVQCIVPTTLGRLRVGSIVRLWGIWQATQTPSNSRQSELLVEDSEVIVVSKEEESQRIGTYVSNARLIQRASFLNARFEAASACARYFRDMKFLQVPSPVVAGDGVFLGPTHPFAVTGFGELAFLVVNNQLPHHYAHARGANDVWELSRLFWAHSYNNRYSLNEIAVVDLSMKDADRFRVKTVVEGVLEEIASAVRRFQPSSVRLAGTARDHSWQLPAIDYDELLLIGRQCRLEIEAGHVISHAFDEAVCDRLNVPGYWLMDSPPANNPFYVKCGNGDNGSRAASLELRLRAFELGAGSEWNRTIEDVRDRESLSRSDEGREYLKLLERGFPACAGFTMGFDRCLAYMLGADGVRDVTPSPRNRTSFRLAPAADTDQKTSSARLTYVDSVETYPAQFTRLLEAAEEFLSSRGFVRCDTSLLEDVPATGERSATAIQVSYFKRRVTLAKDKCNSHHSLLAQGCDSIYEISPSFDERAGWIHEWRMDVSWICPTVVEVWRLTSNLLKYVVTHSVLFDHKTDFISAVEGLSLTDPAFEAITGLRSGDVRRHSCGDGFTWEWKDRVIAAGGCWSGTVEPNSDDTADGIADLLSGLAPPAGGFSVNLSAIATNLLLRA